MAHCFVCGKHLVDHFLVIKDHSVERTFCHDCGPDWKKQADSEKLEKIENLGTLAKMKDKGIISQQEFDYKKKQILNLNL